MNDYDYDSRAGILDDSTRFVIKELCKIIEELMENRCPTQHKKENENG